MLFFANLRIKIRNFIKKHKNKVILALIFWIIIITINFVLNIGEQNKKLINTYEPHKPIFETDETVPKKIQDDIVKLIDGQVDEHFADGEQVE